VPARTVAVVYFSEQAGKSVVKARKEELAANIERCGATLVGEMETANYNYPFTAPSKRRNEVMTEVQFQ